MYNVNSIIYNEFNKRYSNVNNNIHTYFVSIFEKLTQYVNIRIKCPIKESCIFTIFYNRKEEYICKANTPMNCGLSEKSWDKYGACHGRFEPAEGISAAELICLHE